MSEQKPKYPSLMDQWKDNAIYSKVHKVIKICIQIYKGMYSEYYQIKHGTFFALLLSDDIMAYFLFLGFFNLYFLIFK